MPDAALSCALASCNMDVADESGSGLAPGVPADYYERIAAVEAGHWWHVGMRALTAELLAKPLAAGGQALLDAGCGTGGFLRWAAETGAFSHVVGTDISTHAIELARRRTPELELHVAPLSDLPFGDAVFDVVTINDVLQHVPEDLVTAALRECGRVMRPTATLLIRTNGARRARRERSDWRVYDGSSLAGALRAAGLRPERITYAAFVPSLWAVATARAPRPPQEGAEGRDGVPDPASPIMDAIGRNLLAAERIWLRHPKRRIPFGHTLFAVARRS
jgi:SAM-dependent methyltransferase